MKRKYSDEELAHNGKARNEPVIFRKFNDDGEIIALFPGLLVKEPRGEFMTDYLHLGQHGTADYDYVISQTKPAKPAEYNELKEELEEIGYDLRVMQRRIR